MQLKKKIKRSGCGDNVDNEVEQQIMSLFLLPYLFGAPSQKIEKINRKQFGVKDDPGELDHATPSTSS
jgi:hypothetical protein